MSDKQEPITIIVEGGVVQEILNVPPCVTVEVRDYDTDGEARDEAGDLKEGYNVDPDGSDYAVSQHSSGDESRVESDKWLDAIRDELDGKVWNAETLDRVAEILRGSGRTVGDMEPSVGTEHGA